MSANVRQMTESEIVRRISQIDYNDLRTCDNLGIYELLSEKRSLQNHLLYSTMLSSDDIIAQAIMDQAVQEAILQQYN